MRERFGGLPDGYVQVVPNTLAGGEEALRALLALPEPPTAVASSTDLVAVACSTPRTTWAGPSRTSCRSSGFDDLLLAAHTVPALTTLRMPIAEIVGEGVELAIQLARDPAPSRRPGGALRTELVVRQSTAPPSVRAATRAGDDRLTRDRSLVRPSPGRGPSLPTMTDEGGQTGSRRASPRPSDWPMPGTGRPRSRPGHRLARVAGNGETDDVVADVRASGRDRRCRRVELDLLKREAVRQIGRLDAIDERSAFQGHTPARCVDPWVGPASPGPACQASG